MWEAAATQPMQTALAKLLWGPDQANRSYGASVPHVCVDIVQVGAKREGVENGRSIRAGDGGDGRANCDLLQGRVKPQSRAIMAGAGMIGLALRKKSLLHGTPFHPWLKAVGP